MYPGSVEEYLIFKEEQKERTAFLALHNYSFELSQTTKNEQSNLQAAIRGDQEIASQRNLLQKSYECCNRQYP